MTEEIIIDGVNVVECEYFAKQNEHSCLEENGNCENISNCYYKQRIRAKMRIKDLELEMQRLEQENKELKEIINKSAKSFCDDYLKTFEENKFLNKQIMEVKFNAQQEIEFLTEENNSYRSVLEKIKELL